MKQGRACGLTPGHKGKCSSQENLENQRQYKQEYNAVYFRTSNGKAASLIGGARKRARERGLPFDLTQEWVTVELEIAVKNGCPYLKIPIRLDAPQNDPHCPSIDQFMPGAGYTQANCLIVSHKANTMKQDAPPEFVKRLGDNVDLLVRTRFSAYNRHVVAQEGAA